MNTDKYNWAIIPIRTHLLTEKDDIIDVVMKYTGSIAKKGDVIIIAESPVAITQGRAFLSRNVKSGLFARFLSRFPNKNSNLATPQAMQLAIDEVGKFRIFLGAVAAAIGKTIGRKGDFYRVAGKELAKIDNIAGTLPPYDKYIVMGPENPQEIADIIYEKTGINTAIVDVNDLKCVDILAISGKINVRQISKILRENPLGNDDQQTPLAVLKRKNKK